MLRISSKEPPKGHLMLLQSLLFQRKLIRQCMKTKNWFIKVSDKLCSESIKKIYNNKKKKKPFPGSDLYANTPQHLSPKLKDFEVREVFLNINFITTLMK